MNSDETITLEDLIPDTTLESDENTTRTLSPILPQRIPSRKSAKGILGSASRGVGVLRNAKSSTILTSDKEEITDNKLLIRDSVESEIAPKTFISKQNGEMTVLQSTTSRDVSRSSSRLSKKSKKSTKGKSTKKKKPATTKQEAITVERRDMEVQTEIENASNSAAPSEIGDESIDTANYESAQMPSISNDGNIDDSPSQHLLQMEERYKSLDSKPQELSLTKSAWENIFTDSNFDPSTCLNETIEDTLERLAMLFQQYNPDIKSRTQFRSYITSIISKIRKREKEDTHKVVVWKSRYSKLQENWKQCMHDFDILVKEKENIRQERDSLLCTQKDDFAKRALLQGVRVSDSKFMMDLFILIMQHVVNGIKDNLNATYALCWVFDQESNTLKTIVISPNSASDENLDGPTQKLLEEGLTIPCTHDLVGECFQKSEAINLLTSFKEDQYNYLVDQMLKINTKTMLCYPIISTKTQTAIGVLQLINKAVLSKKASARYTVDDEEKLNQYTFIISRFLESVRDFYSFGRGSRKQFVSSTPNRIGRVTSEQENIEFLKFHGGLLPIHVKSYIAELYAQHLEMHTLYEEFKSEIHTLKQQLKEKDETIQNLKFNQFIFVEDQPKKRKKNELYKNIKDLEKVVQIKKKEISKIDISSLRNSSTKTSVLQSMDMEANATNANDIYGRDIDEKNALDQPQSGTKEIEKPETRFVDKETRARIEAQKLNRKRTIYRDIYVDIFAEHPIPLMLLSKYFQVVHVNRKLCQILQYTQNFIIGKLFSSIATKISHSNLAAIFQNEQVDDVRIKVGTSDCIIDEEDRNLTKIFTLLIREIGYVDTKFKLINNKVPLEGPLYLVSFIEKHENAMQ